MLNRQSSKIPCSFSFQPPPCQRIAHEILRKHAVELFVLRLDTLDPHLGGNKWFKLQEYLKDARRADRNHLLSFGGVWSNHLYALAAAGRRFGFATTGIVRGERPRRSNPLLDDLEGMGMRLVFVSRSEYRQRHEAAYLARLRGQFNGCYIIPEGGAGALGAQGAGRMLPAALRREFDVVALACGSGTSAAGLLRVLPDSTQLRGFAVVRAGDSLRRAIAEMAPGSEARWHIDDTFAGAGFARVNKELVEFMDDFTARTAIPLEPVYTAKLFKGLFQLISDGEFPAGTRILALHTGGLQGLRGMQPVMQKFRTVNQPA